MKQPRPPAAAAAEDKGPAVSTDGFVLSPKEAKGTTMMGPETPPPPPLHCKSLSAPVPTTTDAFAVHFNAAHRRYRFGLVCFLQRRSLRAARCAPRGTCSRSSRADPSPPPLLNRCRHPKLPVSNAHTHMHTHACTHACSHTHKHTHTRARIGARTLTHTHTCIHTHTLTHTHTHTHTQRNIPFTRSGQYCKVPCVRRTFCPKLAPKAAVRLCMHFGARKEKCVSAPHARVCLLH